MDSRVEAIRNHPKVGRGSCSCVDECVSDEELVQELNNFKIRTPEQAIKYALEAHRMYLEQATNCRWGEDNDPQLKALEEWEGE